MTEIGKPLSSVLLLRQMQLIQAGVNLDFDFAINEINFSRTLPSHFCSITLCMEHRLVCVLSVRGCFLNILAPSWLQVFPVCPYLGASLHALCQMCPNLAGNRECMFFGACQSNDGGQYAHGPCLPGAASRQADYVSVSEEEGFLSDSAPSPSERRSLDDLNSE